MLKEMTKMHPIQSLNTLITSPDILIHKRIAVCGISLHYGMAESHKSLEPKF